MTVGLGSCVGVALHDARRRIGGLAHIPLGNAGDFPQRNVDLNLAKFADTAVPALVCEMIKIGARKGSLRAKIAGGGQLFGQNSGMAVGERNVEAVRKALTGAGIPLVAEDVGGTVGRTVRLLVGTGDFMVSSTDRKYKVL